MLQYDLYITEVGSNQSVHYLIPPTVMVGINEEHLIIIYGLGLSNYKKAFCQAHSFLHFLSYYCIHGVNYYKLILSLLWLSICKQYID